MKTVISVKFKEGGKVYFFDPGHLDIKAGDGVVVETSRGVELGQVAVGNHELPSEQVVAELKGVERIATQSDYEQRDNNLIKEKEAYTVCAQKITQLQLDMKLVNVEYAFDGSKIVFYFTSDGRVDFRELVKKLASMFKTRIELRQIGVRDEAKILGGLGACGRPICCKAFLPDFQPVSIKMAKEQNLSLSPSKISGICGRLMCCLKYEQDSYETMHKQMPRVGKEVISPDGQGTVIDNNVITERTKIRMLMPDGTYAMRDYPFQELELTNKPKPEYVRPERPERNSTPRPPRPRRTGRAPAKQASVFDADLTLEPRNATDQRPQLAG